MSETQEDLESCGEFITGIRRIQREVFRLAAWSDKGLSPQAGEWVASVWPITLPSLEDMWHDLESIATRLEEESDELVRP